MFVDIETFKGALAVENMLTPYKKGRLSPDKKTRLPKEKITPQVCMEILKSTNYARNIKDMLLCIAELPASEQAQFNEVVSACFSNREQPNDILVLAKKLAHASGYDTELTAVSKPKDGEFLLSDAKGARGYRNRILDLTEDEMKRFECFECTVDEFSAFQKKSLPHQLRLPKAERVYFTDCNFEGVDALTFHPEAIVFMDNIAHLPEKLDVSTCKYFVVKPDMLPMMPNWTFAENGLGIDMRRMKPSGDLDLSRFGYVHLMRSNLKDVSGVHFRDGAVVLLREAKNLPKNIDFSRCVKLDLSGCDLKGQQELSLRDGADVDLDTAQNLPFNIDFSRCVKVNLSGCDLKGQSQLCFDEAKVVYLEQVEIKQQILNFPKCKDLNLQGTSLLPKTKLYFPMAEEVNFSHVTNLPKDISVSHCAKVNLRGCDLKNLSNLKFAEGAQVYLYRTKNLPSNIDVSGCKEIDLSWSDLRHQHQLKFAQGSRVVLKNASNVPNNLDFSPCTNVKLEDVYFNTNQVLSFADGAVVSIGKTKIGAPMVDFSNCDKIYLWMCDFKNVEAFVFKNEKQFRETKIDRGASELFFMDSLTDEQRRRLEKLKAGNNQSLKQVWRNMTNLLGR